MDIVIGGLVIGSLYAIVALGYTMVYGIIELINFAHGDVFTFAAFIAIHPPWGDVARGFVPQVPHWLTTRQLLQYSYFGVAILSAVLFPYESYFYSSGGIEEGWGAKDLLTNRVTATAGFAFGSLLAMVILLVFDLAHPRFGVVRVTDPALIALAKSF